MKNEYLPSVQCPCCKNNYIIQCSHAEYNYETDKRQIFVISDEEMKNRNKEKRINAII